MLLLQAAVLAAVAGYASASKFSNGKTSLTFIYQSNLNSSDDANHVGAILLDPLRLEEAAAACSGIGESLISKATLLDHQEDFVHALSYQVYARRALPAQRYYIDGEIVLVSEHIRRLSFLPSARSRAALPVLCTQSSNDGSPSARSTPSSEISIESGGNTFVGYCNKRSFRFSGIPYADTPARFTYSKLYSRKSQTIRATAYGPQCVQGSSGSEDCLTLNIQTPYIPKAGSNKDLRPVLFWIHGGGFEGGTGADRVSDGGHLASREDIVVVSFNYRLGTLGFLAIPGTDIRGNYGIADQIVALDWCLKNIARFGGDPRRITLMGESAGAGSVRVLLGSPHAIGKFQGAVLLSNLGGGVSLGLNGNYATTYSSYLTIEESYARAGPQIFANLNCTQASLDEQIACLKKVPATTVVQTDPTARYVVQDGRYVNTPKLELLNNGAGVTACVPTIFGITAHDGASFSDYPRTPVSSQLEGIQIGLGISEAHAQSIIDSGLFPYYDTGNVTLDSFNVSQRVATDHQFRCIDQASVYAGTKTGAFKPSYYYQFERTTGGYDPNNLGGPPVTPGYPNGNPNLPYFKLHGADLAWVFGGISRFRDENDHKSIQLTTAYFAEFVKSGQPNPPIDYLKVRGYKVTLDAIQATGPWSPVSGAKGPIQLLDYPSRRAPFQDLEQCAFLKYPISYYLDGGR